MRSTPPRQRIEDFTKLPSVPRPDQRARKLFADLKKSLEYTGGKLLRAECAEIPDSQEPDGVLGGIEATYTLLGETIKTIYPNRRTDGTCPEPWDVIGE